MEYLSFLKCMSVIRGLERQNVDCYTVHYFSTQKWNIHLGEVKDPKLAQPNMRALKRIVIQVDMREVM